VECHLTLSFLRLLPHSPSVRYGPSPFGLQPHARLDPLWCSTASELRRAFTCLTFSSLAMTCASPSFRLSGKCPHATHGPLLSAHVQIPFMYCLGTLVLDRLASYSTYGIPLTTRIHRSKVWRRATRKAVPERSGITRQSREGWASSTRVAFAHYLGRAM
jgi:hypothetical protein